ncbi:hypothetical protein Tco_0305520 [Tanacetum coccineum]
MAWSGMDLKMAKTFVSMIVLVIHASNYPGLASAATICQIGGVNRVRSELHVMSSYIHPSIPSDYNVEDAFSSTNAPNYIPTPPGYFLASPGNTSPNFLDDLTKDLLASLALSPFYDDPYMKIMQAYDATNNELPIPPQALIAPPTILPSSPVLSPMFDFLTFLSSREDFTT